MKRSKSRSVNKYGHPLKIASGVILIAGWVVGNELQRRALDEAIDEALDKREAEKKLPKY